MNLADMIAVLEAAKDGKPIEQKAYQGMAGPPWTQWVPFAGQWDFIRYTYRVKPELVELYVNVYAGGKIGGPWKERKAAEQAAEIASGEFRTVHLREVIE